MDRKMAWLAGALTAVAVSAGTVALTAVPAAAATCRAPEWAACAAVSYQTSHVKSVRVEGRCLIGPSGHHPDIFVNDVAGVYPELLTYGGSRCEGNTHNSAQVRWANNVDNERYRWVTISR